MGKRRALIPWLHVLLHVCIFIGFVALAPLGGVYFNYTSFAKQVLGIEDVVVCPPNCTIELALLQHDSRAVIVVDNPSGTPVALNVYTTQDRKILITTNRATRLEVFFDGGLYVDVYPLYPFSDAEPRSAYLSSGGNLTIRVIPPAIAGTLPTLIAVIGTVIGIMTSLGIIRRVTRTPLVDAIGTTPPTYFEVFLILFASNTIILFLAGWLNHLGTLRVLLPFILAIIYAVLMTIQIYRYETSIVDRISLFIILLLPWLLLLLLLLSSFLIFSPTSHISDALLGIILFTALVNPIVLVYFKSFAVVEDMERTKKVAVLHLYDLAITFWVFQWLINPYPAIFKQIFYISFHFIIFLVVSIIVYLGIFIVFIYPIAVGPGFGTFLLSAIPFVFNEELATRVEFCRKALDWPTKVRVYPGRGGPVEGFVVKCEMGKIVVYDHRNNSTRVFSWGDVQQIERL